MSVVVDCSVTLAWIYCDERIAPVEDILDFMNEAGAWVPAIWPLEVLNGLQQGVRQQRISVAMRDKAIADLAQANIEVDLETNRFAWTKTARLADRFRLTSYDACYLELAQRRRLPLASLDRELRAAGRKLGIRMLGV